MISAAAAAAQQGHIRTEVEDGGTWLGLVASPARLAPPLRPWTPCVGARLIVARALALTPLTSDTVAFAPPAPTSDAEPEGPGSAAPCAGALLIARGHDSSGASSRGSRQRGTETRLGERVVVAVAAGGGGRRGGSGGCRIVSWVPGALCCAAGACGLVLAVLAVYLGMLHLTSPRPLPPVAATLWAIGGAASAAAACYNVVRLACVSPGVSLHLAPPAAAAADIPVESAGGVVAYSRPCRTCGPRRRLRASHCRVCDVCVEGFCHHCMFGCVGARNRRYFLGLLLALAAFSDVVVWCAARVVADLDAATAASSAGRAAAGCALALLVAGGLSVVQLNAAAAYFLHTYIGLGVTLRERRKRGALYRGLELERSWACVPRPFNRGIVRNAVALWRGDEAAAAAVAVS